MRDNNTYVAISRDDFRFMLRNEPILDPKGEKFVSEMVEQAITRAIKNKYNVIVDQTNVNMKHLVSMVEFCENLGDVEFKIFDIPLKTALERDAKRERSVGKDVLERMYKNYLNLFDSNFDFSPRKKKPYIAEGIKWDENNGLPKAVIFDIDGTLSHMQGKRGSFDWNRVSVDVVDERLRETLNVYKKDGYKIIIVTGRDGVSAKMTEDWLIDNKIDFDYLFTKPADDFRKDSVNKTEIYNEFIKGKFNVLCSYDDREQAVTTWRSLGVKCYQVAEGTF